MSMTIGHVATRATLPPVLTPILGRDGVSSTLHGLLADANRRLVTVLGPGGVGKTRLAIHVASVEADAGREVLFVPVAAMRDPALVLQAIGHAAGASGEAPEDALPWVVEAVQDRELLLVLDNLEQVRGVAPDLARLLEECPLLTILATSRAPLGIDGEERFPLAPLDVPGDSSSTEEILDADAVALFVSRARAANPTLAVEEHIPTIGEICRRLDGLPLAIELAAARMSILPPRALLERLDGQLQVLGGMRQDVPDRQRTMRETIAWSYELLDAGEQAIFRHLGVFAGGFGVDAVAFVGDALGIGDPDGVVTALVDQSLVRQVEPVGDAPRYQMLETVRSYALEQLESTGEADAAYLAMMEFLQAFVERVESHVVSRDQVAWLNRIDAEAVNLREAIEWALANGHAERVFRIMSCIAETVPGRGNLREERGWVARALAMVGDVPPEALMHGWLASGKLAHAARDNAPSQEAFERAMQLATALGDRTGMCRSYMGLANNAYARGDHDVAQAHYERAGSLARELDDHRSLIRAVGGIGLTHWYLGDHQQALRKLEEAQEINSTVDDAAMEAMLAMNLGVLHWAMGDVDTGGEYLERSLEIQRATNNMAFLPLTIAHWALFALTREDFDGAETAYAEAASLFRERGSRVYEAMAVSGLSIVALKKNELALAASRILESNRLLAGSGDQTQFLENAEQLADVCARSGHHARAASLLAAATGLREQVGLPPDPARTGELKSMRANIHEALGPERFDELWQVGQLPDVDALARRVSTIAREVIGTQQASPDVAAVEPVSEAGGGASVLTPREAEILKRLAEGRSTNAIAKDLDVKPRTVATHVANILAKLEVPSRTAAVAWAMRMGVV